MPIVGEDCVPHSRPLPLFGTFSQQHLQCQPGRVISPASLQTDCPRPGQLPGHKTNRNMQLNTARRILAKAILSVIGDDIQQAAGPQQLCAGQIAGIEAAIHTMKSIFSSDETDAVLLINTSNAFNSLNRQAALHAPHLQPSSSIHTECKPNSSMMERCFSQRKGPLYCYRTSH